ncbi:MAG TPA: OmpA family protein [Myxococcota bacterium]|nr:OmpA family protein [Myxococcota bacterium]HOD07826.1 OmpA family protein [Myxococcota bacterium]HPB50707.1 OmpA family protein [Myxococcota bacterium]HQP95686.1 OmpA family protein [Myxococcota bacterium]
MIPTHLLAAAALVVCAIVAPMAATAQEPYELQVNSRALLGDKKPSIVIGSNTNMHNVTIKLTRDDNKVITLKSKLIRFGQRQEFFFDQEPGRHEYTMEIKWGNRKEADMYKLDVVVAKPMQIEITKDTINLEAGTITFVGSEAVALVTLNIVTEDGVPIMTKEFKVQTPAGQPTTIQFQPPRQSIGYVELKAHDQWGFYNGIQMTPFFVQIPAAREVIFETGKWDVLPGEEPKLVDVLDRVLEALEKLGGGFQATLYIAGYTDTVGSNDANYALSEKRARAISQWFRGHGLRIRTCYQGFGEDSLAVMTADNVDEERNRRTIFVIAAQAPGVNKTFPRANWKCL